MKSRIARLAVRPEQGKEHLAVIGITHPEVLKADTVYEIIEIDGEHVIQELGPSALGAKDSPPLAPWGKDISSLFYGADELGSFLTAEEFEEKVHLWKERCNAQE